ncbi:GNAT family N-acetyltransferase [Pedobacter foliorum]|uniref:GNAT family N-acetyltransferase n=1 Tax=Pedobacter foliorum TaxID=2739058 RepID=UPI001567A18F|nr:N-acetyltransferase [Pedobacter foliorum]NRF39607.1 N-acetyltransferase [Pedobacter foliorum]
MNINIREERPEDFHSVFDLIEKAFRDEKYSDHKEHFLVERLRKSEAFVPGLSLVCEVENKIVGYILLTKIKIKTSEDEITSLALAPVAVIPEFQGKGIGGRLIEAAHLKASDLGYQSIILLGHEKYYPKFGYHLACEFGISLPFDVPKENCMAIELQSDALKNIRGEVVYPKEFFE